MQYRPFQFVPENPYGRDFIVGDVHGMFSALEELMQKVSFNPKVDRLFSVGDLIDRGPSSWRVVEFLNKRWFFAAMGNHEKMLLDAEASEKAMTHWTKYNGGAWWKKIPKHLRPAFCQRLSAMPIAIEVKTKIGRVGIVHADVPADMSWGTFVNSLQSNLRTRNAALWSRTRYKHAELKNKTLPVDGLDLLVLGHTPVKKARRLENVYFLDTGAFYTDDPRFGTLSMLQVHPQLELHTLSTGKKLVINQEWEEDEEEYLESRAM